MRSTPSRVRDATERWHADGRQLADDDLANAEWVVPLDQSASTPCVVIPGFNAAATIVEALESLATQVVDAPFHVLFVDDCSTDNTVALVRDVAETFPLPIGVLRMQRNGGVSRARNVGLIATESRLIVFLDADDLAHPDYVDSQMAAHQVVNGPAITYALLDSSVFASSSSVVSGAVQRTSGAIAYGVIPAAGAGSMALNREAIETIGLFDPTLIGCEDFDLSVRAWLTDVPLTEAPGALCYYRQRDDKQEVFDQRVRFSMSHVLMTKKYWPIIDYKGYIYWQLRGLARIPGQLLRSYRWRQGDETDQFRAAELLGSIAGYVKGSWTYRFPLLCPWGKMLVKPPTTSPGVLGASSTS